MNDLTVFQNPEFGELRTVEQNGEIWFCLADICRPLGIRACDCRTRLKVDGTDSIVTVDRAGRKATMTFVNEGNLYRAIFQSRKPEADRFTDWVTEEVLPSIRKTGRYENRPMTVAENLAAQAQLLVEHLGIRHYVINIHDAVEAAKAAMPFELSAQSKTNLPPRIRMATLYAVAQSHNGRVANTCNLSEDWVGYSTRYGDAAGDFSPCSHLTVQEVKAIGRELGLPPVLVDKVPIDGLCGKTDEENLGFLYAELDRYIRTGEIDDQAKKERIDRLHRMNRFKLELMPSFRPEL